MKQTRLYLMSREGAQRKFRLFDAEQKSASAPVLFKEVPSDFGITSFIRTDLPEDADFFAIPQQIKQYGEKERRHVEEAVTEAQRYGKDVLVFLTGDYCHRVVINTPHTIVFTGSEYKSARNPHEIVFAPFTEDLGDKYGLTWRTKREKPTVSFCGYAQYPSFVTKARFTLHNILLTLTGRSQYKRGLFWRQRALSVLRSDTRITPVFIERTSFSGNTSTIAGNPEEYRKEFVDSIRNADFVLCPKGDANFSSRFYEILSMGRIPVMIDTDMVLPFEKQIDYSQFIVRVPYTEIDRVGDYIMEVWEKLSDEEYLSMQKRAREIYRNFLRFDSYFNRALPLLKEGGVEAVL